MQGYQLLRTNDIPSLAHCHHLVTECNENAAQLLKLIKVPSFIPATLKRSLSSWCSMSLPLMQPLLSLYSLPLVLAGPPI